MDLDEELHEQLMARFYGRTMSAEVRDDIREFVRWYIDCAVPGADDMTVRVFADASCESIRIHVDVR